MSMRGINQLVRKFSLVAIALAIGVAEASAAPTEVNVTTFGAKGNGEVDDAAAFQRALDVQAPDGLVVRIPKGLYRIGKTIRVHSKTTIKAEPDARIFLCDRTPHHRGDYLLTNANHEGTRDHDITLDGGIWDGNARRGTNVKPDDIFLSNGWSGVTLNFRNINNLRLRNMELANSVTYNVRMCLVDGFDIRNINFSAREKGWNQDGLHFNGYCFNGEVENIRAITDGQTNDDLLAFNADDSMARIENFGMVRGPITNITCRNIYAANCHSAVRLLSVDAPIHDIVISNLVAGCRLYAVNGDGARYCRTPLFKDSERKEGVGHFKNIHLMDCEMWATENREEPLCAIESNTESLRFTRFKRNLQKDRAPERPFLQMRKTKPAVIRCGGQTIPHPMWESTFLRQAPENLLIRGSK